MIDPEIRRFHELVASASRIVFFTGAGISTDSGIPDFRSPGGVWDRFKPIDFGDFMASEEARIEAWRRKFETDKSIRRAKPNIAHTVIADLTDKKKGSCVITQNIDGLHQASGVRGDRVIELHGNTTYAKCLRCQTRYALDPIRKAFEKSGRAPVCECGGYIKTATISFGQAMPEAEMARAEDETRSCDLFIAIGSSLVVQPAAGFLAFAKHHGAKLAILNRDPTEFDRIADLTLHREIGPVMASLAQGRAALENAEEP
ncbi:SIR2 family NAD-dependent protein deacylase [Thioalkalivibrio sp. HK1]|uniref:SIR2 family NAD-dependent protein deacylase n=1 Tax=Thioalkalivibrio sp. HK1 TaxID=1469245 RepID=UPI00046F095F|nr:Sir2 family NAD-dependent protein deacetylase [Thioalkalivibrio sp. HK1]